jgi:hypothetical protein
MSFLPQHISFALNTKTAHCKAMLKEVKILDNRGKKLFEKYSKDYATARNSNAVEDNLIQSRSLLELYENDRSIFLFALESQKCFTAVETRNLEEALANSASDAVTVKSWIEAQIGIPGKKFYGSYIELPQYITTPQRWTFCGKKGTKFKSLTCKTFEGKLRWVDSAFPVNDTSSPSWPTNFIDGKVNMIEARNRIKTYFEENSRVASLSGSASVEFMRRTSYPGLFNFDSEPKLSACRDFATLQDKAGILTVKFVVAEDGIKPDPNWVIPSNVNGELIVNQKFNGQTFLVPVRIDVSQGEWSSPGTFANRRVALIDGTVFRFSAC